MLRYNFLEDCPLNMNYLAKIFVKPVSAYSVGKQLQLFYAMG